MPTNSFIIREDVTISFKCACGDCYSLHIGISDNVLILKKLIKNHTDGEPVLFTNLANLLTSNTIITQDNKKPNKKTKRRKKKNNLEPTE